jgi:hypothetical protein
VKGGNLAFISHSHSSKVSRQAYQVKLLSCPQVDLTALRARDKLCWPHRKEEALSQLLELGDSCRDILIKEAAGGGGEIATIPSTDTAGGGGEIATIPSTDTAGAEAVSNAEVGGSDTIVQGRRGKDLTGVHGGVQSDIGRRYWSWHALTRLQVASCGAEMAAITARQPLKNLGHEGIEAGAMLLVGSKQF